MLSKDTVGLKNYLGEFSLFIEIIVFLIFLIFRMKYNQNIVKLMDWVISFKKSKKIKKNKLNALVVFTDYILHNIGCIKNSCLNRALILFHFLNRMEEPVVLHFGIKKEKNSLIGHSWLSKKENAFLEKGDLWRDFTSIVSFPSKRNGVHENL